MQACGETDTGCILARPLNICRHVTKTGEIDFNAIARMKIEIFTAHSAAIRGDLRDLDANRTVSDRGQATQQFNCQPSFLPAIHVHALLTNEETAQ